jgi:hypothetical protein
MPQISSSFETAWLSADWLMCSRPDAVLKLRVSARTIKALRWRGFGKFTAL